MVRLLLCLQNPEKSMDFCQSLFYKANLCVLY